MLYPISQIVRAILKLAHFSKKGEIAAIDWEHSLFSKNIAASMVRVEMELQKGRENTDNLNCQVM